MPGKVVLPLVLKNVLRLLVYSNSKLAKSLIAMRKHGMNRAMRWKAYGEPISYIAFLRTMRIIAAFIL